MIRFVKRPTRSQPQKTRATTASRKSARQLPTSIRKRPMTARVAARPRQRKMTISLSERGYEGVLGQDLQRSRVKPAYGAI